MRTFSAASAPWMISPLGRGGGGTRAVMLTAGATVSAPFAGVHLVEATKQVYRTLPARRKKLVPSLQPVLEPVLAPSPGGVARLKSPLPT